MTQKDVRKYFYGWLSEPKRLQRDTQSHGGFVAYRDWNTAANTDLFQHRESWENAILAWDWRGRVMQQFNYKHISKALDLLLWTCDQYKIKCSMQYPFHTCKGGNLTTFTLISVKSQSRVSNAKAIHLYVCMIDWYTVPSGTTSTLGKNTYKVQNKLCPQHIKKTKQNKDKIKSK